MFKPSSIFQVHIKLFTGIREQGNKSFFILDDGIKSLPLGSLDRGQQEKRTSNLQMAVLFNRACLFTAKKLQDYQNSGLGTISGILTILLLILLTIVSFAAINYGLYKTDPGLFEDRGGSGNSDSVVSGSLASPKPPGGGEPEEQGDEENTTESRSHV